MGKYLTCSLEKNYVCRVVSVGIDPEGLVRLCSWEHVPAIGSAVDTPIEILVENAQNNPVIRALLRKGPMGAAEELVVYNSGEFCDYFSDCCLKCEEIFKELKHTQ